MRISELIKDDPSRDVAQLIGFLNATPRYQLIITTVSDQNRFPVFYPPHTALHSAGTFEVAESLSGIYAIPHWVVAKGLDKNVNKIRRKSIKKIGHTLSSARRR